MDGWESTSLAGDAAGYHVGLATSLRRVAAERSLKTVGLFDKFETVTFGEDIVHGKRDPEIYLLACERAGFAPEECAAVEDSRNGCVSGITAGCHVFAVPDIVPLPQDVADGCEAVLDTLFDRLRRSRPCAKGMRRGCSRRLRYSNLWRRRFHRNLGYGWDVCALKSRAHG